MLRFDRRSGNLAVTDLGRAASHFYISHESVFRFNGAMMPTLTDSAALNTVCLASEFDQVKASRLPWVAVGEVVASLGIFWSRPCWNVSVSVLLLAGTP